MPRVTCNSNAQVIDSEGRSSSPSKMALQQADLRSYHNQGHKKASLVVESPHSSETTASMSTSGSSPSSPSRISSRPVRCGFLSSSSVLLGGGLVLSCLLVRTAAACPCAFCAGSAAAAASAHSSAAYASAKGGCGCAQKEQPYRLCGKPYKDFTCDSQLPKKRRVVFTGIVIECEERERDSNPCDNLADETLCNVW